jgi:hypothetical protein
VPPQPVEQVLAYLEKHEKLAPVFAAMIRRLNDGTEAAATGGSAREMRVRPLPPPAPFFECSCRLGYVLNAVFVGTYE